jgi:phosphohistidine phosphatase
VDIYLIRHADAVAAGDQGITEDEARPLSGKGHEQAQELSAALRRKNIHLDRIVTSPLLRATQTAEVIRQDWGLGAPEISGCDHLAPGRKRKKLVRFLRDLEGTSFALVGHEPDLGNLAAWLIGSKKAQIAFAKSGIGFIHCDDKPGKGSGILTWLLSPQWFFDGASNGAPAKSGDQAGSKPM